MNIKNLFIILIILQSLINNTISVLYYCLELLLLFISMRSINRPQATILLATHFRLGGLCNRLVERMRRRFAILSLIIFLLFVHHRYRDLTY